MSQVIVGCVHGDKVDGHFYEHTCHYSDYAIQAERERLSGALLEAVEHIEDPDLAAKYRQIAQDHGWYGGFVNVRSGPLLSMGRGVACASFLESTQAEWFYMTDADMAFSPDTPKAMVDFCEQAGLKFLAGVAWITHYNQDGTIAGTQPNVYQWVHTADGRWLVPVADQDLPPDGPASVGAVGAATILVHRDVLTKVRDEVCGGHAHWWQHLPCKIQFTPEQLEAHRPVAERLGIPPEVLLWDQYGEDTSFCIRVAEAGFPIVVHMGIRLGHLKPHMVYRQAPALTATT